MKIGINGRFLVAKQTGVQRAAFNLVKALIQLDTKNQYVIFTSKDQINRPIWQRSNVKVIGSDLGPEGSWKNNWWEQFTLPRLAKQEKIDILCSPANMAPLLYKKPSVLFIYDLCFVVNPQWYSYSFRTIYNLLIPRLAKKAARVITSSNNSRNDLLKFCGISSEKVNIVYLAADEIFSRPAVESKLRPNMLALSPKSKENKQIILYVGSLEPRKNIKNLLAAYELMREERPELSAKLILIGCESPLFAKTGLKIDKFKEDIEFKGFVDDVMLREYYNQATVVAYPSIYEGFGLPPLEAMATGTPVITSYSSSLPEVVGNAAIMIDPFNVAQLKDALINVLANSSLQEKMRESGFTQAAKFNWSKVARDTLTVFYELADDPSHAQGENNFISMAQWQELEDLGKKIITI